MILIFAAVGVLAIIIGAAGFTEKGLMLSSAKRLNGKAGRTVGSICIVFGVAVVVFCVWFMFYVASF